jgi:hypothetical protein
MNIEEMTAIIEETIEETRQDLEATGHFIQSVIDISLQVMTALQAVSFNVQRSRSIGTTPEDEVKARVIDKIILKADRTCWPE